MQDAIKLNQKAQIERIAVLFKNVGEQEEGMRLYTSNIIQGKIMRSIDSILQRMYGGDGETRISEYFA